MSDTATLVTNPQSNTAIKNDDLILDRYHVKRLIGRGGFGSVWEGFDNRLQRTVAIKQLHLDGNPERIKQEARAAARLRHPAIVTLYEAHQQNENCYLITELIAGENLANLIDRDALSDRDVAEIAVAICQALAHAHSEGVIHRDLKPQNILVPEQQGANGAAAKLADFGVAHLTDGDTLTQAGDVIGTLSYMPPEQAKGQPINEQVDLYSLALTIYEAFTGSNPLRGNNPAHTVSLITDGAPLLSEQRPDLPQQLSAAVDRALELEANQRGSLQQLQQALLASINELSDTPRLLGKTSSSANTKAVSLANRLLFAPATTALACWGFLTLVDQELPVSFALIALVAALITAANTRIGWTLTIVGNCVLLGTVTPLLAGAATLLLVAVAPGTVLLWRSPQLLPYQLAGIALGLLQLPASLPLVAGLISRWQQRAALAASASWALLVVDQVTTHKLILTPTGSRDINGWQQSATTVLSKVLIPLFSSGAVALVALSAVAAALIPALISRGPTALRMVILAVCSGALISADGLLLQFTAKQQASSVSLTFAVLLGALLLAFVNTRQRSLPGASTNIGETA